MITFWEVLRFLVRRYKDQQRDDLHHRIAEIVRRISWPKSDPHPAIYFKPPHQAVIVATLTLFNPQYWVIITAIIAVVAIVLAV